MDLILQGKGQLIPIEIKLTTTPQPAHLDGLKKFRILAGEENCNPGILLCRVHEEQPLPFGITAIPWQEFPVWLRKNID